MRVAAIQLRPMILAQPDVRIRLPISDQPARVAWAHVLFDRSPVTICQADGP